jgi:hypothetical protein
MALGGRRSRGSLGWACCPRLLWAPSPPSPRSLPTVSSSSFRNWYHVNTMVIDKGSPLFEAMGGMHNVYINSTGETALKKGEPYPDKTVLLVDLHEFTISDGSYVEGPRKATAIMLKDKKKYASTGGWGFQAWAGGDPTKPLVTDPTKQCFECHQPKKDQDYVYSTYIP